MSIQYYRNSFFKLCDFFAKYHYAKKQIWCHTQLIDIAEYQRHSEFSWFN